MLGCLHAAQWNPEALFGDRYPEGRDDPERIIRGLDPLVNRQVRVRDPRPGFGPNGRAPPDRATDDPGEPAVRNRVAGDEILDAEESRQQGVQETREPLET